MSGVFLHNSGGCEDGNDRSKAVRLEYIFSLSRLTKEGFLTTKIEPDLPDVGALPITT